MRRLLVLTELMSAEGDAADGSEIRDLELFGNDICLSAVLGARRGEGAVGCSDDGAVFIYHNARIAGVRIGKFRDLGARGAVGVRELDEHIAAALFALLEVFVVADPSHPAAGSIFTGIGPAEIRVVVAEIDAAHGDDQFAAYRIVFRLMPVAGELLAQLLRFAPSHAFVGGEGDVGESVVRLCTEDSGEFFAVGGAEDLDLAELLAAFYFAVFVILTEQTLGFGPFHTAIFVEGEEGLVNGEIPVVMIGAHPLVDEVAVLVFHLGKAAHGDDRVIFLCARLALIFFADGIGTVEVLVLAPFKSVALAVLIERSGDRRIPSFTLVTGLIRPAGTSGNGDELLGAVGEVQLVDGGSFLGVIEAVGFGIVRVENVGVGETAVGAEHHDGLGSAMALGEGDEDVAVVQQHAVGMPLIFSAAVQPEIFVVGGDGMLLVEILIFRGSAFRHGGEIDQLAAARDIAALLVASRKRERESEQHQKHECEDLLPHNNLLIPAFSSRAMTVCPITRAMSSRARRAKQ